MCREAVADDAQAEIEKFIELQTRSQNVLRLVRNARRDILRRICVNHPHAGLSSVSDVFDSELAEIMAEGYADNVWLAYLKSA